MFLFFKFQISVFAHDIRYLKQMKKDNLLPNEVQKFDTNLKNLLLSQSLLACSIRWCNDLNKSLVDYERELISKQWDEIDSLLKQGQSKTWISEGNLLLFNYKYGPNIF